MTKVWKEPKKEALTKCKACRHPKRHELERGLVMKTIPTKEIPARFGMTYTSALNHMQAHLSPEYKANLYADARLGSSMNVIENDRVDVMQSLQRLSGIAEAFLTKAQESDDLKGGVQVLSEIRKQLTFAASLLEKQTDKADVVMASSPAWLRIKQIILEVLENHPQAKAEFLSRMGRLAIDAPQS